MQSQIKKAIVINLVILLAVIGINSKTSLLINKSDSIPGKVLLLVKGKNFTKGDLVGIKNFTTNYTGERHLTKRIVGINGDRVEVYNRQIYINGKLKCIAKKSTKDNRGLTPIYSQIIPYGKFFVMTKHKDSFDSRYHEFGLVEEKNIEGKAYIIW